VIEGSTKFNKLKESVDTEVQVSRAIVAQPEFEAKLKALAVKITSDVNQDFFSNFTKIDSIGQAISISRNLENLRLASLMKQVNEMMCLSEELFELSKLRVGFITGAQVLPAEGMVAAVSVAAYR
jgi:hypothetical protein